MALVAAPTHRIHSIHGAFDFSSPTFNSFAIALAGPPSGAASMFNSRPNVSYRTRPASQSQTPRHTQRDAPATPVVTRVRRPSLASVSVTAVPFLVSSRAAPPPPIRTNTSLHARTSSAQAQAQTPVVAYDEDPFADPPLRTATETTKVCTTLKTKTGTITYSSYAYPVVSPPPPRGVDRTAASRLVATVLLGRSNRVCGNGRRRMPCAGARQYVPSGLSRMVAVEC
ncbi:hypothetical protein EIP86_010899 [Pleurotus ostreatoroseus]|nr:hypothetical protein EIP86_010899 [Pleurotus ostreatoroseus]